MSVDVSRQTYINIGGRILLVLDSFKGHGKCVDMSF